MRFMATLLSNLVDNLMVGIHKSRCKDFDCFLEYKSGKNSLTKYILQNISYVYLAIKNIQTGLVKN